MDDIPAFVKDPNSVRPYAHFDRRVSFASVANKVMDPSYVKSHAFYPLIEKPIRRIKWNDDEVPQRKDRPIKYAAHVDRCIYQYYAGLLNERYNEFARLLEIRDVAIAYRTNMPGKSNCDFALRAFSAMRNFGSCYVYAGDFENFFETLDHKYLKQRVRLLFEDGHIPDDYYHVLKNATRYSVWPIDSLLAYHGLPKSKTGVKRLNNRRTVLEADEFKLMVKDCVRRPWLEGRVGIPQGLPISGVLANIYMTEFDFEVNELAKGLGGLYMRYSDDFIFIVPTTRELFLDALSRIGAIAKSIPSVRIHPDKTCAYRYDGERVANIGIGKGATTKAVRHIDYLGFSFDGACVRLRQRTVGRYYRRMYRRVKQLYGDGSRPSKRRVDSLYIDFSDWGRLPGRNAAVKRRVGKEKTRGNFLTYAHRAKRSFPDDDILIDFRRHKLKIRKRSNELLREGLSLRAACRDDERP